MGLYDNPGSCRFLKSPGFKDHGCVHISAYCRHLIRPHEWHIYDVFVIYLPCDSLFMRHLCGYLSIKQSFMQGLDHRSDEKTTPHPHHKLCFITTICKVDITRRMEMVNPSQHSIHHRNLMMQSHMQGFQSASCELNFPKPPALREGCADIILEACN